MCAYKATIRGKIQKVVVLVVCFQRVENRTGRKMDQLVGAKEEAAELSQCSENVKKPNFK